MNGPVPLPPPSPASLLAGRELPAGWRVLDRAPMAPSTGGNFSCSYRVEHAEHGSAYLKALDFSEAMKEPDPTVTLEGMLHAYNFERGLLQECTDAGMTRVVRLLHHGSVPPGEFGGLVPVPYLIFEPAEADVRRYLVVAGQLDLAFALRTLHNIAVGLRQMHARGVAHQDLKPSNVLVFPAGKGSKIGDVGSASRRDVASPRDDLDWAGDGTYAPPEMLYGEPPSGWQLRRQACDLYHLGGMATFFMTQFPMTAHVLNNLEPSLQPHVWGGSYSQVLPHLQQSFSRALVVLHDNTPILIADEFTELVRQQCQPDPTDRGHPAARQGVGSQFAVDRYISIYDRMARTVEVNIRRELTA